MQHSRTVKNNKTHLIEARSISFSYSNLTGNDNARRALSDVSFFVDEGERVAILGHNGSGKSTLVKILGALQEPSNGACLINGVNIKDIEFKTLRGLLGMVFQDPENQIVAAMVEDDIAFAPENQGLAPSEIQARVDSALEKVNLLHKRNAPVSALSGGEKQRVALAGAIAASVKILILDEPTAMIDPEGRLDVEEALREIHGAGATLIQVTHQIENFDDINRVMVLSGGQLVWEGITEDFWNEAEHLGFSLPDEYKLKRYFGQRGWSENYYTRITDNYEAQHSENTSIEPLSKLDFEIKNLSFKFDSQAALEDINAEIQRGKWLSIIGRTGSGKSTLVQHLNGLYSIQEGEIIFNGEPLPQKGEKLHSLRQKVGLVFQNPEDQLFSPTVHDELAFAPKNAGFSGERLENAILHSLDCVGLKRDFLERNPIALSGGERRLVAIASVLASEPECLILDEPLAGLDNSYCKRILKLLASLRDGNKTVITITHDLDMALKYSDKILILNRGRYVQQDSPESILPVLMQNLNTEVWPYILKVSSKIHERNQKFPLMFDLNDFINVLEGLN